MCLITDKDTSTIVTKKPLKVYKVLQFSKTGDYLGKGVFTPYREHKIKFNTYYDALDANDVITDFNFQSQLKQNGRIKFTIKVGLHGFTNLKSARRLTKSYKGMGGTYTIVQMIIPIGTKYVYGNFWRQDCINNVPYDSIVCTRAMYKKIK